MSAKMKVGLGETIITPRENLLMRGFARSQVATGVHDDLYARSIVVENKTGETVVMLSLSLVYILRDMVEKIRSGVNEKTGIPRDNVIISCTHTHAGPYVEKAGETYQNYLLEMAVESVVMAWENRQPGRIGIESTTVLELGRNRRRLLYGGLHPDPQVALMKIEDASGKLLGVMFNYGCHPSTLDWQNRLISADWPYYAIKGLKAELGDDVWAAYFQSCQGDINTGYSSELSAVGVDMPIRNYWYIEVKGLQMTDAVLKALPAISTTDNLTVGSALGFFDYPLRESLPFTLEEAERQAAAAKEKLAEWEKKSEFQGTRRLDMIRFEHFSADQRLETARQFYSAEPRPVTISMEQQAVRIGDAVFVGVPGEVFSEIGLEIKQKSPVKKTFVFGIANGYYGYMPTKKEFIEGDYEVDGCQYSPKAGQVCVESALSLIRRVME